MSSNATASSPHYVSTRGLAPELDLRGVTLAGLAVDGGLYVPKAWPQFSAEDLAAMKGKPYIDVAHQVISRFTAGSIPDDDLRHLLQKAYVGFANRAITPLRKIDDGLSILELFHGPTLAFKDVALQLLGCVFEYFVAGKERMTVIGATSGDTGSAAMAALAGRKNINVFILYPSKGPSEIQRKQMTCMAAENVHAIAVDGMFDDCQAIVKALFTDETLRKTYNFTAINSINWLRILAQMAYYFYAVAQVSNTTASFAVPTGNFGNIYAAYAALQCGLPISKLAVASNKNDILSRFFASGRMKAESVHSTLSPSMDIQISSNFERLLFDLCHRNGAAVKSYMDAMRSNGVFDVSKLELATARQVFTAARVDDDLTLKTIREIYEQHGYILDPHSAVGVAAAKLLKRELPEPVIALACAHPAKFPETIEKAIGVKPPLTPDLQALIAQPERTETVAATKEAVAAFIGRHVSA